MREIKFRAWDKEDKKMIDSGVDDREYYDEYWGDVRAIELTVELGDRYVVMQYTGLKDKNGKEIYEGDWLKLISENLVGEVCFRNGSFVLGREGRGWGLASAADIPEAWEVIGNIYENPELLANK